MSPPGSPNVGAERLGRIPSAKHLYYTELLTANRSFRSAEELRALLGSRGVYASREVLAYCRLSHRASVIYFAMTELLGMNNIRIYDGSWTGWGNLVVPRSNANPLSLRGAHGAPCATRGSGC